MPKIIIPIDLGGNKTGAVAVDTKVADYFNITAPAAATTQAMVEKARLPYERKVYTGIADVTGRTITVRPGARSVRPPKAPSMSGGKGIKIPTKVTITDQVTRAGRQINRSYTKHVTIRFPSGATMAAVSKWLFEKCTANKPGYFLSPAGEKYSVVDDTGITDINPSGTPTTNTGGGGI